MPAYAASGRDTSVNMKREQEVREGARVQAPRQTGGQLPKGDGTRWLIREEIDKPGGRYPTTVASGENVPARRDGWKSIRA